MASQAIIDIVNDIQPDLIIWDVLARMHNAEENNNGEMGQVMRAIPKNQRRRCTYHRSSRQKGFA